MTALMFNPPAEREGAGDAIVGYAPLGGLVIDAQGRVTYSFEGRVKATGLDVPTEPDATSFPPPQDASIRWLTAAGGLVAFLAADDNSAIYSAVANGKETGFWLSTAPGYAETRVFGNPGEFPGTVLADSNGDSGFKRMAAVDSAYDCGGFFNTAGTIASWGGASFWAHPAIGQIEVRTPFAGPASQLIATANATDGPSVVRCEAQSANVMRFYTYNLAGALADMRIYCTLTSW